MGVELRGREAQEMTKKLTSIRFSEAATEKLVALTERYGSQTAAVEVAIDRLYTSEIGEGVMLGTQMSQSTEDKTAFRIYPNEDISATDLREEIERCEEEGADYEHGTWEPLDKEGYVETALSGEYLYVWGRLGVVWGGDAQWADAPSVEQGLDWFLNDPDEWMRRG
jgi:hypothetical protein